MGALGVEAIQVQVKQQLGHVGGAVHRQAVLAEHLQVGHGAGHKDDGVQAAAEDLATDVRGSGNLTSMCTNDGAKGVEGTHLSHQSNEHGVASWKRANSHLVGGRADALSNIGLVADCDIGLSARKGSVSNEGPHTAYR